MAFTGSNVDVAKPPLVKIREAAAILNDVRLEMHKIFLGHEDVVDVLLMALLSNGHVLVEGVPGIAKTLVIRTMAQVCGCSFKRVQFTVDLLPTDIIGLTSYDPKKGFEVIKGPIFAHFVIADEINRSPPKTQSALLQAMQEGEVTIGRQTFALPQPFFVMANQNPIESEGVYSLPQSQIDRFMFKVIMDYPTPETEEIIMERNATFIPFEEFKIKSMLSPDRIFALQDLTQSIYLDVAIKKYILAIISHTRSKEGQFASVIELGCSPRASIALFIASKAHALLAGRNYVLPADVRAVAPHILRHRLILSYKARAENMVSDTVIREILHTVRAP